MKLIYVVKIDSPTPNEILDRQLYIININSDQFPWIFKLRETVDHVLKMPVDSVEIESRKKCVAPGRTAFQSSKTPNLSRCRAAERINFVNREN